MNLCGMAATRLAGGIPHTRGDEPQKAQLKVKPGQRIPHTRGDEPE